MNRYHRDHADPEIRQKYAEWLNAMQNHLKRSGRPGKAKRIAMHKKKIYKSL
jgi:hypothetical protein